MKSGVDKHPPTRKHTYPRPAPPFHVKFSRKKRKLNPDPARVDRFDRALSEKRMHTYCSITYQIVFSTKYRKPCLIKAHRPRLYKSMHGILQKHKCLTYRIGGVADHVHLVFSLHRSVALADLVKALKLGCLAHDRRENLFPAFRGWQNGYAAFTYSAEAIPNLVDYVKRQEEHHRRSGMSFRGELIGMLEREGVEYDERYLE